MIRNLKLRARVLHDGEIRASLTLEFESAPEFWLRQAIRSLAMLGTYRRSKHGRAGRQVRASRAQRYQFRDRR